MGCLAEAPVAFGNIAPEPGGIAAKGLTLETMRVSLLP